jgi:hypothetical protein
MKNRFLWLFAVAAIILALTCVSFGQGKSKGKGNGNGIGNGRGNSGSSVGDIFGNDNQPGRGNGKKDDSIGGILGDKNKGKGNSNRFKGLSKKTGISPEALQTRYEIERRLNPDLTYGQFVAAHMVAKNHPGISTSDILGGLRNGQSIGQILHERGWDKDKINKERKRIKKDRDRDHDGDYDDDDRTWRLPF